MQKQRIIRRPEVCRLTGLSFSTIRRLELKNQFPRRRRLGPNSIGWTLAEIETWIETREAVDACEHQD